MLPLGQIFQEYNITCHSYADNTKIYLALSPNDFGPIDPLCLCIEKVNSWMQNSFLELIKDKTEIVVFGNKEGRLRLSAYLESKSLQTKTHVKNLGVILNADLIFCDHIKATTKTAFWYLRNIEKIRDFVSQQDLEKLMHAFVSSRLDYCNALLTGLPKKSIKQLQLIQNAAARTLTKSKSENTSQQSSSLCIGFQYNSELSQLVVPRVRSKQGEKAYIFFNLYFSR